MAMVGADGGTAARRPGEDARAALPPLRRRGHTAETAVAAGADSAGESRHGRPFSPSAVRGPARLRKKVGRDGAPAIATTIRSRRPRPLPWTTEARVGFGATHRMLDDVGRPGRRLRRLPSRRGLPWTTGRAALLAAAWLTVSVGLAPTRAAAEGTRVVTDSAGRRVVVPARVERVFAAGPPATVFLYTLAPDTLLGWYRPLTLDERAYIPPRYAALPTLGKLTGRSNTPNLEAVREARPDVILDYGAVGPREAALADRIQRETGVPYVLLDGSLAAVPRAYETAGELLGVAGRAAELGRYAARVLAEVDERVGRVPADRRPRVYYARPPGGLSTELIQSLQVLGAANVATGRAEAGALVRVSLEQVAAWDPDVIVTIETAFAASVRSDPAWQGIKAVRDGRVYLAPLVPFPWLDLPPSVNRLAGLKWLGRALYPDLFPEEDVRQEALAFYRLFYRQPPTEEQLTRLLRGL